jgi:ribonuclease HI
MKAFKIHCDGGARPTNPGNGYGSYEVVSQFSLEGGLKYKRRGERIEFGFMSNNEAEYAALLHGLKALIEDLNTEPLSKVVCAKGITLSIYSDSLLMVQQLTGNFKTKKANIVEIQKQVRERLREFGHWRICWNDRNVNVAKFGH